MNELLDDSVWYLEESVALMQESVETLKRNSEENKYITQVMLQCSKACELIPEFDVERARNDLNEEVEPLVSTLQEKLKKSLSKMKRELDTLNQTYELNALRLNNSNNNENMDTNIDISTDVVVMTSSTNEELEELKELRSKKEQLLQRLESLKET